jgi:hypothetical protein
MKKLIFLLLSSFLIIAYAKPILLVERDEQQIHFVYPDLKADGAYYYAVWRAEKSNCEEIKSTSRPLILINVANKIYQLPKKQGFLCLRHSDKLLEVDWGRFQIRPDEQFTMTETDDSRGVGIPPPVDIDEGEINTLLPCEFEITNEVSVCEINL